MKITESVAPSYEQLRPMKQRTTSTFPVYEKLADTLATTTTHPDPIIAHVLGTCASYAYADLPTVSMIMARMGLDRNHCRGITESVDAMFISATSYLVQSRDGKVVILCYRGTRPTDVIEWMTNADISPERISINLRGAPGDFDVHSGYYRNVRSVRYEVIGALQRALNGQSVRAGGGPMPNPLEALYITGHSLGGAMAALMAVMLVSEPAYAPIAAKLRAVYTIGQTMVGSPAFAKACDADPFLGTNVIRYIYRHDVAPQFPPSAAGPFAHFGPEYRCMTSGRNGDWRLSASPTKQMPNLLQLVGAPIALLVRQVPVLRFVPFHASLADHLPQHYLTALAPEGVRSEFGD